MINFFGRFFRGERLFASTPFALDISDEMIRFVKLEKKKDAVRLENFGSVKLKENTLHSGEIVDEKYLVQALVSLKAKEKIKSARMLLPEEQTHYFNLTINKSEPFDIQESIEMLMMEHLSHVAEEFVFDYRILYENVDILYLRVVAIKRVVLEKYSNVFAKAGIAIDFFEPKEKSITRCLMLKDKKEDCLIIDMSPRHIDMFFVFSGMVVYSAVLSTGENLTQKMLSGFADIRDEAKRNLIRWHTRESKSLRGAKPQFKKIFVSGSLANIKEIDNYFGVGMKINTSLSNAWTNIKESSDKHPSKMHKSESLAFVSVLGLALGIFEKN